MSCETIRDRLLDYLDGELDLVLEEQVREHLGICLECRREWVVFRDLKAEAAKLRRAEAPVSDLWPDIESRLLLESSTERRPLLGRWSFRVLAAAASLALVVGSALWIQDRLGGERIPASEVLALREIEFVARADQARVESGVMQMRKDLLGELDRRRDELELETWQAIAASLHELDQAIGEIHKALDAHPEDQQLNHLLAHRYRQELDFLRRITRA